MKLTVSQLRRIISEEVRRVVEASGSGPDDYYAPYAEAVMAHEDGTPEHLEALQAFMDAFDASISDEAIADASDPDIGAVDREVAKAIASLEAAGLDDSDGNITAMSNLLTNTAIVKKNAAHVKARRAAAAARRGR
jgi:hypothetical protein